MSEIVTACIMFAFCTFLAVGGANDKVFSRFFARSTEAQYRFYTALPTVGWRSRNLDRERHLRSSRRSMLIGGVCGAVFTGAWVVTTVLGIANDAHP